MIVQAKLQALKGIKLHEFAMRFLFGGLVCVLAGVIAKRFGPEIGGLFLAFPAIFPAGASLVEAHEKKHKARVGIDGTRRGRTVAGVDAVGAALGSIGLAIFALVCALTLTVLPIYAAFCLACLGWIAISISLWMLRKGRLFRQRHQRASALHAFRPS